MDEFFQIFAWEAKSLSSTIFQLLSGSDILLSLFPPKNIRKRSSEIQTSDISVTSRGQQIAQLFENAKDWLDQIAIFEEANRQNWKETVEINFQKLGTQFGSRAA